jgi:hypothetical protein
LLIITENENHGSKYFDDCSRAMGSSNEYEENMQHYVKNKCTFNK